jgi:hypothetical protein
VRRLLAGIWAGLLLAVAVVAAPAAFATLTPADTGRLVARVFATEAYASLALAVAFVLLERLHAGTRFGSELMLALIALFCTVAGYFALQPMMAAARAGQGAWSFGQLHSASLAFYAAKTLAVLALAWRVSAPRRPSSSRSSDVSSPV